MATADPPAAHVLVVDDEPSIRRLVSRLLHGAGYGVSVAASGPEALDAAAANRFDLILLDVSMPGEDGLAVCRRLNSSQPAPPPVVFLTAHGTVDDRVVGLDSGAVDYVAKPFEARELLARVRAALRTKHRQDALTAAADTDGLTGLLTRRALDDRAAELFSLSRRHKRPLACLMIDVDHFKRVNDTHGHQAGDEVLRAVAARLRAATRTPDVLGRYGGEEFAALLPETDAGGAQAVAEKLRAAIAATPVSASAAGMSGAATIAVTASIGIATLVDAVPSVGDLFAAADAALYRAKREGRNRVVLAGLGDPAHATPHAEAS